MATATPFEEDVGRVRPRTADRQRTLWGDAWRRLLRDRFAILGGLIVAGIFVVAFGAPLIAPHSPITQFPDGLVGEYAVPLAPGASPKFTLGTDTLGRDFLSRIIWGARISMTVSLLAVITSLGVAIVLGGLAGYLGGWLDTTLMRLVDLFLSFPALLLQIAIATVLPPSLTTVIVVITIFAWAYPARVFRGQTLSLRERPFVEAARALGVPELRIFFRHILPQLWPTVIVFATLRLPAAILTEAGLSFVGLGVRPPTPSWGNLILEGFRTYRSAPWLSLFPGLAIMLAVLSFNLLGDGLRDALDPKQRHSHKIAEEPVL